jgi:hypothetical protein
MGGRVLILLAMLIGLLGPAGCASSSIPSNYREPENRFWGLIDHDRQRQILDGHYGRARLRAEVGPPTIDDGDEWVYVGKYEDTTGVTAGMLMAITASLDDPVWKTVVVTFGPSGGVERINVGSTKSAIADGQRRGILFGVYYDRGGRVRASTQPTTTTGPTGGGN